MQTLEPLVALAHAKPNEITPDAERDSPGNVSHCSQPCAHEIIAITLSLGSRADVGSPDQGKGDDNEVCDDDVEFGESGTGGE